MNCRCLFSIALASIVFSPATHLRAQESTRQRLTALAQPYVDASLVVGLSIGAVKGDEQVEVHLGRVREGGPAPDGDTIYEIGSVSKVFTGLLLADGVVRQELRLDQPAQDLLPDGVTMPGWEDQPIKLIDLATHSSGLPRLPDNMLSVDKPDPYADYTSKLAHEFLNSHRLRRAPGTKHEYSNFATSLLGHLISDRAKASYDQMLNERITGPLKMEDTRVTLNDSMRSRLAEPHVGVGAKGVSWNFADLPGAGGIRSSTRDMLRFVGANLHPPEGEIGKAIDLAWKRHRPGGATEPAMGLGWHFAGDGSTRWHNGQTGGYHSMVLVNRQLDVAVVVLSNTAQMELDRLGNDLIRMLAGADVQPRTFEKTVDVSEEKMKRFVGKYQLAPGFVFDVKLDNNRLMVRLANQPTLQVYPRSETEWFYKVVDATIKFSLDDDGKCNSLELHQNGIVQTAKRIN